MVFLQKIYLYEKKTLLLQTKFLKLVNICKFEEFCVFANIHSWKKM